MKKIFTLCAVTLLSASMALAQMPLTRKSAAKLNHRVAATQQVQTQNPGSKTLISTFPYDEGFENGISDWTLVDNDNDNNNWAVLIDEYITTHAGSACVGSYSYSNDLNQALSPDNWLISSGFQIPAGSNFELSWYDATQDPDYPSEQYSVYIATSDSLSAFTATTAVFNVTLTTDSWTKRTVSLSSYAGQTIYVAFRHHNSTDNFMMKLDDIHVGAPGAPEVAVTGATGGFTGDTLTFAATCSDTAATINWIVSGTTPSATTGDTITAVWASAGTYTVQAYASNAIGADTATLTVNIISCETITTLPWSEGFEAGQGCWQFVDNDSNDNNWSVSGGLPHHGEYELLGVYSSNQEDNWAISQSIAIPTDASGLSLSWYVMAYSATYPETYEVLISTNGSSNLTDFDSVYGETIALTDYTKRSVSLASYAGQTINVAFRHRSTDMFYILIDDVRIGGLEAPEDLVINGPTEGRTGEEINFVASCSEADATYAWTFEGATPATANTASATVVWDNPGTYNITLTATNAAGSSTANATITVIQCNPITEFPFEMGFEGNVDLGCWTFIDADGDGYIWNTTNFQETGMGHNGSDYVMASASYDNPSHMALSPDNWLFTPALTLPEGSNFTLSWYEKGQDASYASEHYAVYIASAPVVDNSLTASYEGDATAEWVRRTVDLTSYAGQTIYVGFRHYNVTDMFILDIDDLRVGTPQAGIDEVADVQVTLYPNPTSGMLHISAENVKTVSVLDVNGRTVMSQNGGATIDMSDLADGTYFVRTVTEKGVSIQRVVKK